MKYGIFSKSHNKSDNHGWYGGYMMNKVWWVCDKKDATDFMSRLGAEETIDVMRQLSSMPEDCVVLPILD